MINSKKSTLTEIKSLKKLIIMALITTVATSSHAVYVSENGTGEVLIFPFYTVNVNHNTLYSIVNTTADTKAVKVTFREGENGAEVLSFNLYMSAFDVYVGSLSPALSTFSGHAGESSVNHVSNDQSCTPYLNGSGQQFLPFQIDLDVNNNDMQRTTEGSIEVIELSTFDGQTVVWADHGFNGVPEDCGSIQSDWDDNSYDTGDEVEPKGGLIGAATILNVSDGYAVAYDAIGLDSFWQGEGQHIAPGSLLPNLGNAWPESLHMVSGAEIKSNWPNGTDAISAALMQYTLKNQYNLTLNSAAKTEWVLTFPTKYLHVNAGSSSITPFSQLWNGNTSCDSGSFKLWDDNEFVNQMTELDLCYSTNVLEIVNDGTDPSNPSALLGSYKPFPLVNDGQVAADELGWAQIHFNSNIQSLISLNNFRYQGLPVVGLSMHSYFNAAAPEGLLATYAELYSHQFESQIKPVIDLIFENGFERNQ